MAERHGASLTALYAVTSAFVALPFAMAESAAAGQMLADLDRGRRSQARQYFDQTLGTPGPAVTWEDMQAEPVILGSAQRALNADLLVLGQHEIDPAHAHDVPPEFVQSLLIDSGKPAIVVPHTWDASPVGDRVLVGWNATRESARALAAALPLLQHAQQVDVAVWQDDVGRGTQDIRAQLVAYLQAHGVAATLHWYGAAPGNLGDPLLTLAADLSSDLLVMGCYGHSRAREIILGGTSSTVLRNMTLPVLMAH